MEALSKGKSDKQIDSFDSELEDDFFDAEFDMAFDEAFHQAVSAPLDPNNTNFQIMHESWLKVEYEINKINARKKRRRTLRLSFVIAASVALGAVLFSVPTNTQAVSPFVQTIKDWGNGMKSIIIKDRTNEIVGLDPLAAKTSVPPEPGIEDAPQISPENYDDNPYEFDIDSTQILVPVEVTEEEARSGFIGDFLLSNVIPERFTDIKFELMLDAELPLPIDSNIKSTHMRVLYTGKIKDRQEEILQFDYAWIHPGEVVEGPLLRETSVVKLDDGSEAFMSIGPRYNTFQWMMGSTNVSLFGTLSEEEMLSIANNLQNQRFPWNSH
ncbi:hypothetical protein DET54_1329 [Paenibacillus pabuli]|uniref:DUF4367 domain-containing protein n=1 Tax=Paenibacillus pabuli TaxID=1472 RepID=A0A855Y803_9BACL|nr:hypothetical protein DET56_107156 [Paenibacillus pabuli]PXW05939.1 hypothetical protein DEU73_107156 [Paenibacillus taichungensis]RAI83586.1 hypothetical protein DET54_1329 [Paenibacillus pabuli]